MAKSCRIISGRNLPASDRFTISYKDGVGLALGIKMSPSSVAPRIGSRLLYGMVSPLSYCWKDLFIYLSSISRSLPPEYGRATTTRDLRSNLPNMKSKFSIGDLPKHEIVYFYNNSLDVSTTKSQRCYSVTGHNDRHGCGGFSTRLCDIARVLKGKMKTS